MKCPERGKNRLFPREMRQVKEFYYDVASKFINHRPRTDMATRRLNQTCFSLKRKMRRDCGSDLTLASLRVCTVGEGGGGGRKRSVGWRGGCLSAADNLLQSPVDHIPYWWLWPGVAGSLCTDCLASAVLVDYLHPCWRFLERAARRRKKGDSSVDAKLLMFHRLVVEIWVTQITQARVRRARSTAVITKMNGF